MVSKKSYDHNRALQDTAALRGQLAHLLAFISIDTDGSISGIRQSGQSGVFPLSTVDVNTFINANNGTQQLTTGWNIQALDAQPNSEYVIDCDFHGTFENQTLQWAILIDGVSVVSRQIGSAFFTAGTAFDGWVEGVVQVQTTGTTGTISACLRGGVGIDGNRSSGTNNNNAVISARAVGLTLDTTAGHNIGIYSTWGGSTAGQTIVGYGSKFTRYGK